MELRGGRWSWVEVDGSGWGWPVLATPVKNLQKVPLDVSIHWSYLHRNAGKTYSEISKIRSYWKYSKATICRHMQRNIGDLVVGLQKAIREDHQDYLLDKREIYHVKPIPCKKR